MQHGFGESEISWTTTGKANIILDNLIEMGKIKPFTLVMSDGMVQEKVGSEERLNYVLLERMLVEEIIPMAEKKYQFGGCKEKRGMAGLSMGSVQTTRTLITIFIPFSGASEIMTVSVPDFWKRMQSSRRKVSMKSGKSIRADMTGMCGDRALRILRR